MQTPCETRQGGERDGHRCKATGRNGSGPRLRGLEVVHIFKRAVAIHCQSDSPRQFRSAIATMDIIKKPMRIEHGLYLAPRPLRYLGERDHAEPLFSPGF